MSTTITNPPVAVSDDSESEDESMLEQQQGRSCVTFSNFNQVIEIPNRETLSQDAIRRTWNKKDDYQTMRRDAFETIQLHRAGELLPGDSSRCLRGLEGRTSEGYEFVKNNRIRASFCVLDEQDRQDEVGICDSDLIAEAYQGSSLYCRCVAYAQGLMDAQEVISDLLTSQGPGTECASSSEFKPSFNQALAHSIQLHLLNSVASNEPPEQMSLEETIQEDLKETTNAAVDMDWTAAEA